MIAHRGPREHSSAIQTPETEGLERLKRLQILIIGINYAPELTGIAPYTTAVAEHYAKQGHDVRVITGAPHYPEWRRQPAPSQPRGSNPMINRYWHFVPKRATAFSRMLYEATWLVSASRGALSARADVVIGIVPDLADGLLALMAGRRCGAPVGLVVKDLVGPAAAQSGYRGGKRVAGLTTKVEHLVVRKADRVAVISRGFRRYMEQGGVAPDRLQVVCDWTHDGTPSESISESRARLGWRQDDFVCLHAGNMGQKQGLDTVLEAAAMVSSQGIKIVLSGDGNDRMRLEEIVRRKEITNVSFRDLQPPGQYEAMLGAADVLLLNQRASVGDMALPSKLASYFASGRPVVAAVAADCEAACRVEEARGGIVVPPEDPVALANALITLRDSPELASETGASGKVYADRHLSPKSALAGYDVFLQSLIE
jgi:colanic acid biosynthesis glycosyl transferase WcaI